MASKNRRNYGRKESLYCEDGPYKGQVLSLHNGGSGTISFSVPSWNNGEVGRYVKGSYGCLVWEKAKCQNPSKSM